MSSSSARRNRLWRLLVVFALAVTAVGVASIPAVAAPSLSLSRSAVIGGESITVKGTTGVRVARPVVLQRKSGTSWVKVVAGRTTATGAFSFAFKPPTTVGSVRSLRVQAPRIKIGAKTYTLVTTGARSVTTVAQTAAITTASTATSGVAFNAAGAFTPIRAGRPTAIQRLVGSTWTTIKSGTQARTGKTTFNITLSSLGANQLRVITLASAGAPVKASAAKTVTVNAPADTTPPPVPTNVQAGAGDGQAVVTWNAVAAPDLAGYNVYRGTSANGPWTKLTGSPISTGAARTYTATALTNGTTYYLAVTSIDGTGNESAKAASNSTTPQPPPPPPGSMKGNWSGDARGDFAYVTPANNGNGFALAVFESTPAGVVWKGIWYSSDSVPFATTTFIPADFNNDGLLDLYYATARTNGMDVALAQNTGSTLSYVGQQWNPDNLTTATTKFLPGNWSGDARQEFAYVTPANNGNGFALAVFESTPAGVVWKGVWYSSDSVPFATTTFIPADFNNDGLLDLYYATARTNGMDVALAQNTGSTLSYVGQQWNPDNLTTATTKFLPGNWSGDARQEFAYVTPANNGNGFALAVFESTPAGVVWKGVWYSSDSVPFATTTFIPADFNNDGLLDLYYATARTNGMDVALAQNTGSTLSYVGQQWNPDNLTTATTKFLSSVPSPELQAGSGTGGAKQVKVLSPASGSTLQMTSTPDETPPHHNFYGDFAFDQVGVSAYFRVSDATGTVSARITNNTTSSCEGGLHVTIEVSVDGQVVGNVHYLHLKAAGIRGVGPISSGDKIGDMSTVSTYVGDPNDCWTARHTHVELQTTSGGKSCFFPGLLGTAPGSPVALGILGGNHATTNNSRC